ncbi:MAG: exonuclease RecJ [Euryarchaeota archaeon]|nr:exonuclease RecJ [Euryarchaeota archaeon]
MAVTGRSGIEGDLATQLMDAEFVRVAPRADGDAIAAAGLLLRALATRSIPFQARVVPLTDDPPADDSTVPIGFSDERPATAAVVDIVRELDCEPDSGLALAGCLLAGEPETIDTDLDRGPGVGVPTADLADGLAHSTLFHASFSGDETAAGAALANLIDDDRSVASLTALETLAPAGVNDYAATAVKCALRPHVTPDGPFETAEGLADVLDCLSRDAPGIALALAMGHDVRIEALESWRKHAKTAHEAIRAADTGRYDGLFVARVPEGAVETVARLFRDFRSPEPAVLVVSDDEAGAASRSEGVGEAVMTAASAVGGAGGGTARQGFAKFDCPPEAFLEAFREELT